MRGFPCLAFACVQPPAYFNRMRSPILRSALVLLALSLLARDARADGNGEITIRDYFGIAFQRPVQLAEIPGRPEHYLVVEQPGRLVAVTPDGDGGWNTATFARIDVAGGRFGGDERGLLGIAFHPRFEENRKYYVNYMRTGKSATVIAERTADASLLRDADGSQRVLLEIPQPYRNHNGGTIAFGPDGYLHIGMGDGGSRGDPRNLAQDPGSLHGKFLRIDVDGRSDGKPYAIPADNPFVGEEGYLPEIWALGLRNPWKWTFHPHTGEIWAGDVGQVLREKITLVPKGANLGWRIWEGNICFDPDNMGRPRPRSRCSAEGLTMPVLDLERDEAISVTGGVFYTADPNSAYDGGYVFGDYGLGTVWVLREDGNGGWTRKTIGRVPDVSSFDNDSRGRVFAAGLRDGVIRLVEIK